MSPAKEMVSGKYDKMISLTIQQSNKYNVQQ